MSIFVDVHKKLGTFQLDVGFELGRGVLGLLGASGSGKSKTLQCITGIETPDSGRIVINGRSLFDSEKNINLKTQERRVGYLFQNYALFPNMTVEQNIACGVHTLRDKAKRVKAVGEMIERMQLAGLERSKPAQISGGQQQRVALARILVNEPDILLLDEPFSALDSYLTEQLMTELNTLLAQFPKDVIVVTHSRDEAYQLCDRIAILVKGRLDVIGETKQLFHDPETCAGAELTGCKNIVGARKVGDTKVFVPDWGVTFDVGRSIRDGLCAIGIRAHCFHGNVTDNMVPMTIVEEIEQPFEWVIKFRYENQDPQTQTIWWRFAKPMKPTVMPSTLGVAGKDILLLYR